MSGLLKLSFNIIIVIVIVVVVIFIVIVRAIVIVVIVAVVVVIIIKQKIVFGFISTSNENAIHESDVEPWNMKWFSNR